MANSTNSRDIEGLFFQKMPARLLVSIKRKENPYTNALAKHIDCTYAHASKLVKKMEKLGLIETEKDGRTKYIQLTDDGHTLAKHIENLLNLKDI